LHHHGYTWFFFYVYPGRTLLPREKVKFSFWGRFEDEIFVFSKEGTKGKSEIFVLRAFWGRFEGVLRTTFLFFLKGGPRDIYISSRVYVEKKPRIPVIMQFCFILRLYVTWNILLFQRFEYTRIARILVLGIRDLKGSLSRVYEILKDHCLGYTRIQGITVSGIRDL